MSDSIEGLSLLLVIEELIAAEDWMAVETVCTEALTDDAHNATLYSDRGIARVHLHLYAEALEDFDVSAAIEPLNCAALAQRARALLHTGSVDAAADTILGILADDIRNKDACEQLKLIALVMFRKIIAKGFASGQRTQLSYLQMCSRLFSEQLTVEEKRSVQLEFMRIWCDRVESQSGELLFIRSKDLIQMIAGFYYNLEDYKMSLLCLYLTYNAILEDPQSALIERTMTLRNIANSYIKMGSFDSARKVLSIAVSIVDPEADPEVRLFNQLLLCDLQLQAGALDEPMEQIAKIRQEGEERDIPRIVVGSDFLAIRMKLSINQYESSHELFENIQRSHNRLGSLLDDTQHRSIDHLNTIVPVLASVNNLTPNEFQGTFQLANQLESRLSETPLPLCSGASRYLNAFIAAIQSWAENINLLHTNNGRIENPEILEDTQKFMDILNEESHKSNDTYSELLVESLSALFNAIYGKLEKSNEQFERCLNLTRSHQHSHRGRICLLYAISLLYQRKVEEALKISFEAEGCYLQLYSNSSSKDDKITINQEKCLVGAIQVFICFAQHDKLKALYACERCRTQSLRQDIKMPIIEAETMKNQLLEHLRNYCVVNSSIILYLWQSSVSGVHCWAIFGNRIHCYGFPVAEENNDTCITNAVQMFGNPMQLFGNLLRGFTILSFEDKTLEQIQRYVYLAHKLLWNKISEDISLMEKYKRIVIIPNLQLNLIPYATLGNAAASQSLSDYPLLKKFIISQSPSFWALSSTWLKQENTQAEACVSNQKQSLALLIGNPEDNLPAAEEETALVAQHLEQHTELAVLNLTQQLATKDIVLDTLSRCCVVHIASHGNLDTDEQNVRAGAIQLSDGKLFAKDIEVAAKIEIYHVQPR